MHRESRHGNASRYIVACIAFALHLAVVAVLIFSSRTRLAHSTQRSIELLYLPARVAHQEPALTVTSGKALRPELGPTPLSQSPMAISIPEAGDLAPHIDWDQQAQAVAAERANSGSSTIATTPTAKSPFGPPPAHHSGDEFVTATGDRAVFINEHCYQVSKTFADPPNGISNGMGTQTYCIGPAKEARGDLFEQLPAYKKLHPNP